MKKLLLFYSTLFLLTVCFSANLSALGMERKFSSNAWLLSKRSQPGTILFNGRWYLPHELSAALAGGSSHMRSVFAACGGTVGGTGLNDDLDGDGVCNVDDIDDDNDGILDSVESPACFYTINEWNTLPKSDFVTITSDFTTAAGVSDFGALADNNATANAVQFSTSPAQTQNGKALFTIMFDHAVQLDAFYIKKAGTTNISGGAVMFEGSNDNASWTALFTTASNPGNATNYTANGGITLTNSNKYSVATNRGSYKYYRLRGTTNNNILAGVATEFYFDIRGGTYPASRFPKSTACADPYNDGDSHPAHQDLDSDGDGCSDAFESGATTNPADSSPGFSFAAAPDTNEDGLNDSLDADLNGLPDYSYFAYAYNKAVATCQDTDGDGILDLADLDDDNDGISDIDEGLCADQQNLYSFDNGSTQGWRHYQSTALQSFGPSSSSVAPYSTCAGIPASPTGTDFIVSFDNDQGNGEFRSPDNLNLNFSQNLNATMSFYWIDGYVGGSEPAANQSLPVRHLVLRGAGLTASAEFNVQALDNTGWQLVQIPLTVENFGGSLPAILADLDQIAVELETLTGNIGSSCTNGIEYYGLDNLGISCNYFVDTDNDGIPNHLDLDSDGDGCPDLVEAGVSPGSDVITPSGTNNTGGSYGITDPAGSQLNPSAADANNDGLNDSVDPDQNGKTNYTSTYDIYAIFRSINFCADTDNDGVPDLTDIDDDNDGVLDATESPDCFYTADEWLKGARPDIQITTALNMETYTSTDKLVDGDNGTAVASRAVQFAAATTAVGLPKTVYQFEMPMPVQLGMIYLGYVNTNTFFGANTILKLQGSNDESAWTDLNDGLTYGATVSTNGVTTVPGVGAQDANTFPVTKNGANYKFYRILWTSGGSILAARMANEVFFETASGYQPSKNPKATCSTDFDNDGIPNHLDLDSDGDGCSDLMEAAVSPATDVITPAATNAEGGSYGISDPAGSQLNPAATDANNDGLNDSVDTSQDGTPDYTSTYLQYALAPNIRACDYDGDGVSDVVDLDDDNDGILDAVESPSCYFTAAEANVITQITSQFTSPDDDQTDGDIQLLHDGATTLTFNFDAFTAVNNPGGSNLFTIEYPTPVALATLVVSDNISATANANAIVVGSNDGITWSAALSPATVITTTPVTFNITTSQGYKYYRIRTGSVAGALATANTIGEITSTLATGYVASAHPKPTCTADTDGDGIVNHLDLDSDGDGCPDATEGGGGFTTGDLEESSLAGGNSGAGYTGAVSFGVDDNLGNNVDTNGVPTIANGGQALGQSQTAGTPCTEIESCALMISGGVYEDRDGAANGVSGMPYTGSQLYVALVSGGAVQNVATVGADGAYSFTGVTGGTYELVLTVNAAGSVNAALPGGVVSIAEGGAVDAGTGRSMGDGNPNSMTSMTMTCQTGNAHVDFGLDSSLPVTLISFTASQAAEGTLLEWVTADEKDFERFEIEQSAMPQAGFAKIGEMKGGGSRYSFTDAVKHNGASYYRLKMVDTDGSYSHSRIVTVTRWDGKELNRVYPNPAIEGSISINSIAPIESCKVYDVNGNAVRVQVSAQNGTYRFTFGKDVQPGIYVIRYRAGGRTLSQQFVLLR